LKVLLANLLAALNFANVFLKIKKRKNRFFHIYGSQRMRRRAMPRPTQRILCSVREHAFLRFFQISKKRIYAIFET